MSTLGATPFKASMLHLDWVVKLSKPHIYIGMKKIKKRYNN